MEDDRKDAMLNILQSLAHLLGTEIRNNRLLIPADFGNGYCAGFVFNEHIRMMIMNYELHEDLVIENPDVRSSGRMILFKFQNIIPDTTALPKGRHLQRIPSVLIATSSLNTDKAIPVHTNDGAINIEVDADYLNGLLAAAERSPILNSLLQNTQPLLFEQMIYPSLQKVIDEILTAPVDNTFELFFLRIKAEELVCRLLMELEKREENRLHPLNGHDVQTMYKVKEQMLAQLDTPPVIKDLAVNANMSPTKLKSLFRQIFGNSIFSYYQEFRMKEAARLLKEEKRSVADVGYQLGFTNLSHFSKVFKEHIGMKPKQYSLSES